MMRPHSLRVCCNPRAPRQAAIPELAWRASWHIMGWQPVVISLMAVFGLLIGSHLDANMRDGIFEPLRIIGGVIPLAMALQAAFAFSPRDESALEVILAAPRRLVWLLVERLGVVMIGQVVVAVIGMLVAFVLKPGDPFEAMARWGSPAVFLVGFSVFTTQVTQRGAMSTVAAMVLWGAFLFLGDFFLGLSHPFWPVKLIMENVWLIHPYLEPGTVSTPDYITNRLVLIGAGLAFLALAIRHLGNVERLLLGQSAVRVPKE